MYALDIFSGGGGLSLGLKDAGLKVSAAVELDAYASMAYRENLPEVVLFQKDARKVAGDELLSATPGGVVHVLAGCPPCQGYSSLTSKYKRADPRNDLILDFVRIAKEVRPLTIMMENVPGLASKGGKYLDKAISELESLGYKVQSSVLQVADYGVPQNRRRFVLLAGLGFYVDFPEKTHSQNGQGGTARWKSVREAIGGFGHAVEIPHAQRNGGPQSFDWHVVRQMTELNKQRLAFAKPGGSRLDIPKEIRPQCHVGDESGFSNVYGRMSWDHPSPTITAGCTTLSKGRFGHPDQPRTISLREAALLQTFPGTYVIPFQYMEPACSVIGNALPPVFASALARACLKAINDNNRG